MQRHQRQFRIFNGPKRLPYAAKGDIHILAQHFLQAADTLFYFLFIRGDAVAKTHFVINALAYGSQLLIHISVGKPQYF